MIYLEENMLYILKEIFRKIKLKISWNRVLNNAKNSIIRNEGLFFINENDKKRIMYKKSDEKEVLDYFVNCIKIFGEGINDIPNSSRTKQYKTWIGMLGRAYNKNKSKNDMIAYKDCIVCEEWKRFSNFKKWFDENYRWDLEEMGIKIALDKDLLSDGVNKIYSPETCIFLPIKINGFLAHKNRKTLPTGGVMGVSFNNESKKWVAQTNDFLTGKNKCLGLFENKDDAIACIKHGKEVEFNKAKSYLVELGYSKKIVDLI